MEDHEHWSCKNCKRLYKRKFGNNCYTCIGNVRQHRRRCDVVRICDTNDSGRNVHLDISLDEAVSIATGLLRATDNYLSENYNKVRLCNECEDIDCEMG